MNPLSKLGARMRSLRRSDPLVWGLYLLAVQLFHRCKSAVWGAIFGARNFHCGPRSVIRGTAFIQFGPGFSAHSNLWLEAVSSYRGQTYSPRISFGSNVALSDGVHISCIDSIAIGNNVLIGSHVYISDHNHGIYRGSAQSTPSEPPAQRLLGGAGPVIIHDNVWIGDNAVLVGPLEIGPGTIIGANSVVRNSTPGNVMIAGAPAKLIRRFDEATASWERVNKNETE